MGEVALSALSSSVTKSVPISFLIGGPPGREHGLKGGPLVVHVLFRRVLHQHEPVHSDQPDAGDLVALLGSPARRDFLGGQAHQVRDGIGMAQLSESSGRALAIGVRAKISRMGSPDQGVDNLVDDGRSPAGLPRVEKAAGGQIHLIALDERRARHDGLQQSLRRLPEQPRHGDEGVFPPARAACARGRR